MVFMHSNHTGVPKWTSIGFLGWIYQHGRHVLCRFNLWGWSENHQQTAIHVEYIA